MPTITTQWAAPTVCTQLPRDDGEDWLNVHLVQWIDEAFAECRLKDQTSDWLVTLAFEFDIPANASIRGLELLVRRKASSEGFADSAVCLTRDGSSSWGDNMAKPDAWPTTLADVIYGSPSDTWGVPLTPADVNSPAFGLKFSVVKIGNLYNARAYVDATHFRVTYATPVRLFAGQSHTPSANTGQAHTPGPPVAQSHTPGVNAGQPYSPAPASGQSYTPGPKAGQC